MLSFTELATEREQLREAFANLDGGVTGALAPREQVPADARDEDGGIGCRELLGARAALALATGEFEIGGEIARFLGAPLADQRERVRREEVTQLRVREQTHVREIARRLELVQRRGSRRVFRGELVDDEHVASGVRHPRELGDDALGLRDVMERPMRAGQIEGAVRERQLCAVSLDELRVGAGAFPRKLEQLGHGVEADDLPHERREGEGQSTGARADVERSLVSSRLDEVAHLFREALGARILQCGNAIGRPSEAVSRQRCGVRGSGRS